ncbi:unnamed protein product [Peronospora farinosa]|uniref:carbonic anhydrase n=1 Tax=Peronospora farinosa TaxID=134698 RepID=A0AAV0SV45_9STRA|nr:unnamed protein product [Peronospora farinosa]CAI5706113.1 unnamed protein product [Peronospora farinosa]
MTFIASISAVIAAFTLTVSGDGTQSQPWGYRIDPSMVHYSNWANTWSACGNDRQSPINIVSTSKPCDGENFSLTFSGQCTQYNLAEPHEPLEADIVGGDCTASANNATYKMKQLHMHAPSEHTLDDQQLDGEIHFVHTDSDSSALLVVGIFLKIDLTSDEWLSPLLDALEKVNSSMHSNAVLVNLESYSALVMKASSRGVIYNYPGSLTTPSCGETVDWWVVQNPISISRTDFDRLHQDLLEYPITDNGNNARPPQPLNGRIVQRYVI